VRALLVVVLVLAGLLVVADRVTVGMVETRVAREIAEAADLPGNPEVDITGFPFLTQAVRGRYDEVLISLTAEQLGQPEGTRADVALRDVEVALSDVFGGTVEQIPVGAVDGTATLSYALLSAQLDEGTELTRDGDGLRITRTVELLGRELRLTAAGRVTLDGSDLVVDVQEATGAGVDVPPWLLERATDLLDLRYTVPPLPFGLQLTEVTPAEDGVEVRVEAADTVLGALGSVPGE
jgi:hypothetical protein